MDAAAKTLKVSLRFPPVQTDKPIIYHLIRDYGLIVNLLQAEIEPGKRGRAVMDVTGTRENIDKGLAFLAEQRVEVRNLTDTILRREEQCISCGACTAVCPSQALKLGAPDWKLRFSPGDCLHCKQCVPACPMRAIDAALLD